MNPEIRKNGVDFITASAEDKFEQKEKRRNQILGLRLDSILKMIFFCCCSISPTDIFGDHRQL